MKIISLSAQAQKDFCLLLFQACGCYVSSIRVFLIIIGMLLFSSIEVLFLLKDVDTLITT